MEKKEFPHTHTQVMTTVIDGREYEDTEDLERVRCPECFELIPADDNNWQCGEILQLYNRGGFACIHCTEVICRIHAEDQTESCESSSESSSESSESST